MATWKKVIDASDKLSNLSDVNANGSAAGQLLIYNNSTGKYVPAVLQTGSYLTETNADGSISIDQTSANLNDRLANLTQTDVTIGLVGGGTNASDRSIKLEGKVFIGEASGLFTGPDAVGTNTVPSNSVIYTPRPTGNAEGGRFSINIPEGVGSSGSSLYTTSRFAFLIDPNGASGATIEIGNSTDTTNIPGVANLTKPKISGDITSTTTAVDWDLIDDNASAISFDSDGATGILEIITSNGAEKVKMSKDLEVTGDLIVQGDSTTLNTATLSVEDKVVVVANTGSPTTTTGDDAGLQVETSATPANDPTFKWHKDLGGGNTDGAGTANGLTGWKVANAQTSNQAEYAVAIMDYKTDAGAPSNNSAGVGAFSFNTNDDALYIRTA